MLATLVVYAPSLSGDWFWDDSTLILDNPDLRTLPGLGHLWLAHTDWPLTFTAFWLQWHLWGPFPYGYRVVNLALHLADALLLWPLLRRLGLRWAWLASLLFAVHPLAVESVAWIVELKNTLSLFFLLLSLLAWLDYVNTNRGYVRSLLFFLAALLCKTSVVMLPFVLLLHAWWLRGRLTRRDLRPVLPFFALALVFGLVTIHFQADPTLEGAAVAARSPVARLVGAGAALPFYLGKFLWPYPLLPLYPAAPLSVVQLLALPLLAALLLALWTQRRTWGRHALFGLGFFLLNLLPVLGLLDLAYLAFAPVADHFAYLPIIGLIALLVAALEALARNLPSPARSALFVLIAVVVATLAWQAHTYAGLFADGEKLWATTVRLNPGSFAAHNNLGSLLLRSGRLNAAQKEIDLALQLNPDSADAHNNCGLLLLALDRNSDALHEFQTALRLNPSLQPAQANLNLAREKIDSSKK